MVESFVVLAICATMMVVRELAHARELRRMERQYEGRWTSASANRDYLQKQAEVAWNRVEFLQNALVAREIAEQASETPEMTGLSAALASQVARLKSSWSESMVKPPPLVVEKARTPDSDRWEDGSDTDIFS